MAQTKIISEEGIGPTEWGVWAIRNPRVDIDRVNIFSAEFGPDDTRPTITGGSVDRPTVNASYEGRVSGRQTNGTAFHGVLELSFDSGNNQLGMERPWRSTAITPIMG